MVGPAKWQVGVAVLALPRILPHYSYPIHVADVMHLALVGYPSAEVGVRDRARFTVLHKSLYDVSDISYAAILTMNV